MLISDFGEDYKIIKASNGQKLESWKGIKLLRPDPIIIWDDGIINEKEADAVYHRSKSGGGQWLNNKNIPESWTVNYKNLTFNIKQMGFKHTGLFPEQAVNWQRMDLIKNSNREIKVLNLFAYTGGATVACLAAGASVVHVDSSKGMNEWAKQNVKSSNLEDKPVRFLVDDVIKFVDREIRRGNKYDAIIMDPPSFGRGASGEVWTIEKNLNPLLTKCKELLNDDYLFVCVNTYSTNLSILTLENILKMQFKKDNISVDEIALPIDNSKLYLPCGVTGWITKNKS